MIMLPLERLLSIATSQARPGVVVGSSEVQTMGRPSGVSVSEGVDTGLAARMAANTLRRLLGAEVWQQRWLGARGLVGEAGPLRLLVWMDSRDDQPGMVALWDTSRPAPAGKTAYGKLSPRPVLVIGRNVRTGEHFVMRYAPGDWQVRLEQMAHEAARRDLLI
jgi:hypothetical protein